MTRYRTIVADPPWSYPEGFAQNKGGRYGDGTIGRATTAPLPYEGMALADIKALPIADLAQLDGAWLWLWTTNRYLPESFDVARSWGLQVPPDVRVAAPLDASVSPATLAHSQKPTLQTSKNSARLGAIVMGKRGCPSLLCHPDAFLDHIERACPGPYVELFARRARFGWDYAGDGSLGTVELPGLRAPGVTENAA